TILGITFKENVPDIRNSKVIDVARELQRVGVAVQLADPLASSDEVEHEYGLGDAVRIFTASGCGCLCRRSQGLRYGRVAAHEKIAQGRRRRCARYQGTTRSGKEAERNRSVATLTVKHGRDADG